MEKVQVSVSAKWPLSVGTTEIRFMSPFSLTNLLRYYFTDNRKTPIEIIEISAICQTFRSLIGDINKSIVISG